MGISTAVARAAANTSTGNQDITTADFGGGTPKACIVMYNEATADGTAIDNARMGIGFATGSSNRGCAAWNMEHGQTTTDNSGVLNTDAVIQTYELGKTSTIDAEADFVAFVADGIRINWSNAPTAASLITVILFGGSDLSAFASSTALVDTDNNAIDEAGVGFQPDIVFGLSMQETNVQSHGPINFGVGWDNGGASVHRCVSQYHKNGVTTSDPSGVLATTGAVNAKFRTTAEDWYLELSAFDSSGFTSTNRSGGANSCSWVWLALKFGGTESVHLGTYTTPTATGNDAETGPGFVPQMVIMGVSGSEVVDTHYDDNRGGTQGIAAFTPDAGFCNTTSEEDAVTTTNTQSLSDNLPLNVPDDDGTAETTASFVSMDASGFTLNYSAAPGTAKLYWMLSIEEEAAGGHPPLQRQSQQAVNRASFF